MTRACISYYIAVIDRVSLGCDTSHAIQLRTQSAQSKLLHQIIGLRLERLCTTIKLVVYR